MQLDYESTVGGLYETLSDPEHWASFEAYASGEMTPDELPQEVAGSVLVDERGDITEIGASMDQCIDMYRSAVREYRADDRDQIEETLDSYDVDIDAEEREELVLELSMGDEDVGEYVADMFDTLRDWRSLQALQAVAALDDPSKKQMRTVTEMGREAFDSVYDGLISADMVWRTGTTRDSSYGLTEMGAMALEMTKDLHEEMEEYVGRLSDEYERTLQEKREIDQRLADLESRIGALGADPEDVPGKGIRVSALEELGLPEGDGMASDDDTAEEGIHGIAAKMGTVEMTQETIGRRFADGAETGMDPADFRIRPDDRMNYNRDR
jgi:predicted transcriptional regulator